MKLSMKIKKSKILSFELEISYSVRLSSVKGPYSRYF